MKTVALLLLGLWSATLTNAYFYVPNLANSLPFMGGNAFAKHDKSLYIFGGEDDKSAFTNDLYKLTQTDSSYTWEAVPQTNTPPGVQYGQAMVSSTGSSMLLMGGLSNSTRNQIMPLQMYSYNIASQAWAPWGNNGNTNLTTTGAVPLNRYMFSATYDNATKVYIYGGALNGSVAFYDFYSLDVSTFQFTALPSPNIPRYGHTASLLSNGQLVVLGGVAVATGNNGDRTSALASMKEILVYDTTSNTWTAQKTQATNDVYPSSRSAHNAIVTKDDKIVIFGGDNGGSSKTRICLNAVAILDTKTWTWTVPTIDGIPPSRRSYAAAAMLDDDHLTVAFGEALNSRYNDINVYSISKSKWLQSFDDTSSDSGSKVSAGLIAGVTIAGVVFLLICLFLLWRFQSYIRWFFVRLHHDIWKPRTGEPIWAESTRIVCQVFMLFLFVMFLVFVIRQSITSPNVTQRIEQSVAEVDVPDVRFCFEGYPDYGAADPRSPDVVCKTDNGYTCNGYIQKLNLTVFSPLFTAGLGDVSCFLFRSDTSFQMTSTSGANNGSRLQFSLYGDQTISSARVHVSVYPKQMDPNVKVYNINDDIPVIMSEFDVLTWQNNERNDLGTNNVYEIQPFTYNALTYNLIDHRYLQPVGWNYIGFSPITNSTPEIESSFRAEAPNPNYSQRHMDIGFITIYPGSYATYIDREVKMYTLLNALGFVGGVFGMLVAVQAWLFGFRPRSPWGVVHRWSVGEMRRSLLRGLQANFKATESTVPLVQPLHPRFSMHNMPADLGYESEGQRISRVEERMQILELLFKSYYVDDEIFRSLDNATKTNGLGTGQTQGPLFPSEKTNTEISRSNTGGFSYMFNNNRQSVASINSETHSEQHLNSRV